MHTKDIVVEAGDTLYGIADRETGNGNNWPQLYAINQAAIMKAQRVRGRSHLSGPDWIFPGTVLKVPM